MTARERDALIRKKENGTLTEAEHEQYLNLLRTDDRFYEDVGLHQLLNDALRQEADNQLWASFDAALSQRPPIEKKVTVVRWLYAYPAVAVAASIVLILGIIWGARRFIAKDERRVLRIETRSLFRARDESDPGIGKGYAGGDPPVGQLPVKWVADAHLSTAIAYEYCLDTLTLFVRDESDTPSLRDTRLRYDARRRTLSVERPDQPLTVLKTCTATPQPL